MSDWDSSSNVVGELPEELWTLTYLTNLYEYDRIQFYISPKLSAVVVHVDKIGCVNAMNMIMIMNVVN